MVDEPRDDDPAVPGHPTDTGVQRALGERRRRRLEERSGRSGEVALDATTSQWPVVEPPPAPRPVVRQARPSQPGTATAPVLPTPSALVVGPLLEARRARPSAGAGGRRQRRLAAADDTSGPGATRPGATGPDAPAPSPAPSAVPSGSTTGSTGSAGAAGQALPAGASAVDDDRDPDWDSQLLGPSGGDGTGVGRESRGRRVEGGGPPAPTPTPTAPRGSGEPDEVRWTPGAAWRRLRQGRPGRTDLLVLAGVVLVVLLLVVLVVGLAGRGEDADAVQPVPEAPAQQTLALTLADPSGTVQGAALLGADASRVATLLLPADLQLVVADAGPASLDQAVALGGAAVERGLEDTLGLRVDEVLALQPAQLAALVDGAGGVVVDVTREVVSDDVVVAAGDDQRLSGAQAVAYATSTSPDEPPEAGLARFSAVLQALLAALPSDPEDAASALAAAGVTTGAGSGDASSGAVDEGVAEVVAAAAGRAGASGAEAVVLPTREVTAGDASVRSVDRDAVAATLGDRFAGALLPVAAVGDVQVEVRNGVGTQGLNGEARDRLVAAGLRYVGGGNAAEFGEEASAVLVPSQAADDQAMGRAVADALGLGADSLAVNSQEMVDTDVVVVLGADFAALVADGGAAPSP